MTFRTSDKGHESQCGAGWKNASAGICGGTGIKCPSSAHGPGASGIGVRQRGSPDPPIRNGRPETAEILTFLTGKMSLGPGLITFFYKLPFLMFLYRCASTDLGMRSR